MEDGICYQQIILYRRGLYLSIPALSNWYRVYFPTVRNGSGLSDDHLPLSSVEVKDA